MLVSKMGGRMSTTTILVVDDDVELCELLKLTLSRYSLNVEVAHDGLAGLQKLYQTTPNLILLDIMMPHLDGWEACQRIREMTDVPIIIMSALNRQDAIVRGLNLGADDFICKPVTPEALLARIKAVLRRVARSKNMTGPNLPVVTEDNVEVDLYKYEVKVDGRRISLSPTEFRLLAVLAKNKGRVMTHNILLKEVWGLDHVGEVDHLRLYISYLRRKLERNPAHPRLIQTEWNVGYRFG